MDDHGVISPLGPAWVTVDGLPASTFRYGEWSPSGRWYYTLAEAEALAEVWRAAGSPASQQRCGRVLLAGYDAAIAPEKREWILAR